MSKLRALFAQAMSMYARHPRELLIISGVVLLPSAVALTAANLFAASGPAVGAPAWSSTLSRLAIQVIQSFATLVTNAALCLAVADILDGRTPRWDSAWQRGLGRLWPLFTASLMMMVRVFGWVLLLMIPGFWVISLAKSAGMRSAAPLLFAPIFLAGFALILARYSLVTCVTIFEEVGGNQAVARGVALGRGHRLLILGTVGVSFLSGGLLGGLSALASPTLRPLFVAIASWLIGPLTAGLLVVLYRMGTSATKASTRPVKEPEPGHTTV